VQGEQFTVDVCRDCRGAWFDNIDLSAVWNLQFQEGTDGSSGKEEFTEDTVLAVLRSDKEAQQENNGGGDRNVFATIAGIVGGIFPGSD
jgi:Zn-finger nucleic acid-binding protein